MNAVLQFGAGYRTYIIAAVLVLVVVVEKGLGIDVPGVDVGSDWLTQILAALVCCIADFLIAQFGLLTLIQKAYSILAYLAIPVILVPYVVHMAVMRFDTKK